MTSSDTILYMDLYNAWKEEILSKKLTPLNLNFIKSFQQGIETISSLASKPSQNLILKRAEFLIHNLVELRKEKILAMFLSNEAIESSYLSTHELMFYDFIKNSDFILNNKTINFTPQLLDFLKQNSNLNADDGKNTSEIKKSDKNNTPNVDGDTIQVIFLKDVEAFVYQNNRTYGPFKKNDEAHLPIEIVKKVFLPKNVAKEK